MTAALRFLLLGLVRLLVGAYPHWQGCGPETKCRIYFANHSSHLDGLVIMTALPEVLRRRTHPVAAADYWGRNRLTRLIAEGCLNSVLVNRSLHPGGDPLAPLAARLEEGASLVIFPEGTRGDGEMGAFKAGLHHLARRFPNAELVPVYLDNPRRAMPKGAALLVPLICTVRFGAPIALAEGEDKAAFLARARQAVQGLAGLVKPQEVSEC
jgi:1-acyl-sn-glycerol-3-phosphate acyltransferase